MNRAAPGWPEHARWSRGLWLQLWRALADLLLLPARLAWSCCRAGARRRALAQQLRDSARAPLPPTDAKEGP